MKENQTYSQELKSGVIRMVIEQGLKQKEVAKKLSIPKGAIAGWLVAYKTEKGIPVPGTPSIEELAAENARLRKELTEARMEREI